VSDNFYQHMIKEAKHPPLCVCRYSFNGGWNPPWSRWEKVVIRPERVGSITEEQHEDCY